MITQNPQLFSKAAISLKPEDILLQKGSWVSFSPAWQGNFGFDVAGRSFIVTDEPVLVKYPIARILPGNDFVDIDLSNQTMPQAGIIGTLQLYPAKGNVLYQILVGLKKGNYFIPTYIPGGTPVFSLASSYLNTPIFTDGRRYLGAKKYEDSPEEAPLWGLYTLNQMASIVLRLYVDTGIDYEKVVLTMNVNKCKIAPVNLSPDQAARSLLLSYYTEFKDF